MVKVMLPDVWKLSDQNSDLHLDGGEVLQLDDLRDVTQSAVQPTGGRLLTDGQRKSPLGYVVRFDFFCFQLTT